MNGVYKLVWNAATGSWTAVSELAKGRKKGSSGRRPVMAAAIALAGTFAALPMQSIASNCGDGTAVANGGSCSIDANGFDPRINDRGVGGAYATGGDTVTLSGDSGMIAVGDRGVGSNLLGALNPAANGQERLQLGAQNQGVSTPDPITGGNIVVATFDSSNISTSDWGQYSSTATDSYHNVNNGQYLDARFGTAIGGTLVVNLGDAAQAPDAAGNFIDMAAKQTNLTAAGGAGSRVEWTSRNHIDMSNTATTPPGTITRTVNISTPRYTGTFTGFDGQTYSVNSAAELQAYNDLLITALRSGRLNSQAGYDAAFAQAVSFQSQDLTFSFTIDPGDEVTEPAGANYSMVVDGAGATGAITAGGQIDQRRASVLAVNGGHFDVDNGGQLSGDFESLVVIGGSSATNNGVISGGFFAGDGHDTTGPGNQLGEYVEAYTVTVSDAGSTFENNGILNVAGWTYSAEDNIEQYGVKLLNGASAINRGIINVGVNNNAKNGSINGVIVNEGSTFNNDGGTIYLGRAAQYDVNNPESVADTTNRVQQNGVVANAGSATNNGSIIIGTGTQNASAMLLVNGVPSSSITNNGQIEVNGAASGSPLLNTGMRSTESSGTLVNNGVISLNGINGVGIQSIGYTTGAEVSNTGTINVAGDTEPASGTRNYGVWAEGANAHIDLLAGDVNLSGIGAIGVHARNGALVDIGPAASVNFLAGTDQIGYFMYGAGTRIDNNSGALDVSTERSTLFRVEDGAAFLGNGDHLTASGARSALIVGTGTGTVVDTADARLDITGAGASGIRIDGGAQGLVRSATTINLEGTGAVAGLVDGRKFDLSGNAGPVVGASVLTNEAAITSVADDAVAFITQNGGTLVNSGSISLGSGINNTGVIARSGGALQNNADIAIANGTGILVEGAGSASRLVNAGSIAVSDGIAGIHIRDGAYLDAAGSSGTISASGSAHGVLVGNGATGLAMGASRVIAGGTGNGIENQAEVASIRLDGTSIVVNGTGAGIRTATGMDPASAATITINGRGTGIAFQTASGDQATGDLDLGNAFTINGSGAGATGIFANTTGAVSLAASVVMNGPDAGAALVAGTARATTNAGRLVSSSTTAPVVDLSNGSGTTFLNTGTVAAAGPSQVAVLGSSGGDTVAMQGGAVTGVVSTGDGNDTVAWSSGSLNGSIDMGAGDDALLLSGVDLSTTYHVDGGAGVDDLTFAGIEARGGSFAADDLTKGLNLKQDWETINLLQGTRFTLTDNLVLGGSTVNVDASSTLFAGNGVQPVIGTLGGDAVTFNNAGTVDLTNGSSGPSDVLTINGTYVGQGGRLRLETVLNEGGANSISDLLRTQQSTLAGAPTVIDVLYQDPVGSTTTGDGILLVDVAGQSAADAFVLGNRVVGGAYEYLLFQGGAASAGGNPSDGNWYLRNVTDAVEPPGGEPEVPVIPPPEPDLPGTPIFRPETGVYLANQAAAAGMFAQTMHDRMGEVDFTERKRGDDGHRAAWGRIVRNQFDTTLGNGSQVDVGTNTSVYQVGAEMGDWNDRDQRAHWGLMGGYGQANTSAGSSLTGYTARGRVKGYNVGAYGTWYQSASQATGAYVDGWFMYGEYNQSVHGDALPLERYNSSSLTGSLEAGYAFELSRGEKSAWYIEPQAQVIYTNYSGGDHTEVNGSYERARDAGGLVTRLGARVYPRPVSDRFNRVQPFAEVNWWHSDGGNTISFNEQVQSLNYGNDNYELKVGFEAELGSGWTGWGHMSLRTASGDYRDVEGLWGVKYAW